MSTHEPEQRDDRLTEEQALPQYVLPAAIQLQNVFVGEIDAKRHPVEISPDLVPHIRMNLESMAIAEDNIQAQVTLSVSITIQNEPKPFEVSFKIIGSFTCASDIPREVILQFLNQGSLGVLLPSARELLMNLCTRLQIPVIILPMIQLTLPPSEEASSKE